VKQAVEVLVLSF